MRYKTTATVDTHEPKGLYTEDKYRRKVIYRTLNEAIDRLISENQFNLGETHERDRQRS